MPGTGIRPAITTARAPVPARLLDVSRLVSRAGRIHTGVDRVELAYLQHLGAQPEPLFAIARTPFGYVLIGPDSLGALVARLSGAVAWGHADRLSRLSPRRDGMVRRAESDLRRLRLDRCRPRKLGSMLARHLPMGVAYLNTGHSNLTDRMLNAVRKDAQGQIAVLVHDTIPLDFPQFQRQGTPEKFRAMLRRVQARADLVIYNSHHTRDRAEAHMAEWGAPPEGVVAHLGVPPPVPDRAALTVGLPPAGPYFVTLGTIEPRKGHDLLLDVWDALAQQMTSPPTLLICGARGWNNRAVFDRLDQLHPNGPVRELTGLNDNAIAALLAEAQALLCPSKAEGFGLPAIEAVALDVPVICSDLPVYREVLGDIPVYLKETDCYQWCDAIKTLSKGTSIRGRDRSDSGFNLPTWENHFDSIMRFT